VNVKEEESKQRVRERKGSKALSESGGDLKPQCNGEGEMGELSDWSKEPKEGLIDRSQRAEKRRENEREREREKMRERERERERK